MTEQKELVPTEQRFLPEVVDESGAKIVGPELEAVTGLVTQMAQLAQLARIRKAVEKQEAQMERAPVGVMRPFEKTITGDTVERWEIIDDVGQPCTMATIYNDGDDDVYVCLNDLRDGFQKVKKNESLPFNFYGNPLIERFFFKSTSGGSAVLRIPLEY